MCKNNILNKNSLLFRIINIDFLITLYTIPMFKSRGYKKVRERLIN